ncbi:MAG TPA: hypothetical protein DDX92_04365 [Flavobacteriales bacterium]|jgi:hypothetical protein|nr:hypothetical protein [Flavobacteriales bacterium]
MMNAHFFLNLIAVLLISSSSCTKEGEAQDPTSCIPHSKAVEENIGKLSISQGLYGTFARKEGNCMPMIDGQGSTCRTCAVSRVISIYELTGKDDVTGNMPFFESTTTLRVAQVVADANGFFQIRLDPGMYSIFIQENGKLYANSTGSAEMDYALNPIEINENEVVEFPFYLDYAVY